jgi:hypothetical protein
MKILVCLTVKYGFPVTAVLGFFERNDRELWEAILGNFYYEMCVCHEEGEIYILIRDCVDEQKLKQALWKLPLVSEGFLEMQFLQFGKFKSLDKLFDHPNPYPKS